MDTHGGPGVALALALLAGAAVRARDRNDGLSGVASGPGSRSDGGSRNGRRAVRQSRPGRAPQHPGCGVRRADRGRVLHRRSPAAPVRAEREPSPHRPTGTPQCPDDKNREGVLAPRLGMSAPCWPGKRVNRSHGICRDGTTHCNDTTEFGLRWGSCEGYVLPLDGALAGARPAAVSRRDAGRSTTSRRASTAARRPSSTRAR